MNRHVSRFGMVERTRNDDGGPLGLDQKGGQGAVASWGLPEVTRVLPGLALDGERKAPACISGQYLHPPPHTSEVRVDQTQPTPALFQSNL